MQTRTERVVLLLVPVALFLSMSLGLGLGLGSSGCTFLLPFEDYPPKDAMVGPDSGSDGGDQCEPNQTEDCYTGDASSLQGDCHEGTRTCDPIGHFWPQAPEDCVGQVTPEMQCAGRECGPDGCGGSCGSCEGNILCDDTSGVCLRGDMAPITTELTFLQGGSEAGSDPDEDVHQVTLSPFEIDRFEVTNQAYYQCVHDQDTCLIPDTCSVGVSVWSQFGEFQTGYEHHPVVCVTWEMAKTYCEWAGKRLCTEAEWERACVYAEAHLIYPWGDDASGSFSARANCDDGYCNDAYPGAAPVGSFLQGKNVAASVFDLAGNVSEWVLDWYDSNYYSVAPANDPAGPCDGASPCQSLAERVHRGGNFDHSDRMDLRCASREFETATESPHWMGIRCCRDASDI